ncbi:MAG: response regulator transcription factor [Hydrogenibacillus sp.]|nr:response regulator transcription factor [Hydrogenibacillus sp.]
MATDSRCGAEVKRVATVLVVDDDPKIRSMLKRALEYEGFAVRLSENAESAREALAKEAFDLVLLDVRLPDGDGFQLLRDIREENRALPVIMLTARDEVEARVFGLERGADDYVTKPFHLSELIARMRAQLRRQAVLSQRGVLRYADVVLDLGARRVERAGMPVALSGKAFDLLAYFLEHPEQVLSKEMLLARLWGPEATVDANVVEVYVAQLRQKLEEGGRARLIHTVRGAGYVLKEADR